MNNVDPRLLRIPAPRSTHLLTGELITMVSSLISLVDTALALILLAVPSFTVEITNGIINGLDDSN